MLLKYLLAISIYCHSLAHCSSIPENLRGEEWAARTSHERGIAGSFDGQYDHVMLEAGTSSHSLHPSENDITLGKPTLKRFRPSIHATIENREYRSDELESEALKELQLNNLRTLFNQIEEQKKYLQRSANYLKPGTSVHYLMKIIATLEEANKDVSKVNRNGFVKLEGFKRRKMNTQTKGGIEAISEWASAAGSHSDRGRIISQETYTYHFGELFKLVFILPVSKYFPDMIERPFEEKIFFHLQQTGFKMVDIMVINGFVGLKDVRSMFREPQFVENFVDYIRHRFEHDIGTLINAWGSSPYITKHWYWSHLHPFFKVLSTDEEKVIGIFILKAQLSLLRDQLSKWRELDGNHQPSVTELFLLMENLETVGFKSAFGLINRSKPSRYDTPEENQKHIDELVMKIAEVFTNPQSSTGYFFDLQEAIDIFFCNTLELIKTYNISPVIEKLLQQGFEDKNSMHQDFKDKYTTFRLTLKTLQLVIEKSSYDEKFAHLLEEESEFEKLSLMEEADSEELSSMEESDSEKLSLINKLNPEDDRIEQTRLELKKTIDSIKSGKKNGPLPAWLRPQSIIIKVEKERL